METLVTILHVLVCIFLMLTVLLQAGKGGGMGAAFGGGSSMGTVFGGSGAGNFLRRLTVAAAVIFMLTSMTLAWMSTPSTDPLKEYWAKQQEKRAADERAHEDAVKGAAAGEGQTEKTDSTDSTGGAAGAADQATGDETSDETTAEETGESAVTPEGASAPAAGTTGGEKPAADTPAGTAADKPAADKTPAPAPADTPAADRAPAPAPADTPAPSSSSP
jgi:preprotein translocase subunit SecG